MPRILMFIAAILLTLYCVVEVVQTDKYAVRTVPKWLWFFLVIGIPVLGPVAWIFLGRPNSRGTQPPPRRNPDDDPDFLRRL